LGGLAVLSIASEARAWDAYCWFDVGCDSTSCAIICDDSAGLDGSGWYKGDYVYFGMVVVETGNDTGVYDTPRVGVCYFNSASGTPSAYKGYRRTSLDTDEWQVWLGDGLDTFVLADPSPSDYDRGSWFACRSGPDTPDVRIKGKLPEGDGYAVWGEEGSDVISLHSGFSDEPSSSQCIGIGGYASGGPGNDDIRGTCYGDFLYGGDGVDWMWGGAGTDWMWGDAHDDILKGGDDADVLLGGTGEDSLYGEGGGDLIYGGDGEYKDTLRGGPGVDWLDGGDHGFYGDTCYCEEDGGYRRNCEVPVSGGGCSPW
jgi:hypothetical protein